MFVFFKAGGGRHELMDTLSAEDIKEHMYRCADECKARIKRTMSLADAAMTSSEHGSSFVSMIKAGVGHPDNDSDSFGRHSFGNHKTSSRRMSKEVPRTEGRH